MNSPNYHSYYLQLHTANAKVCLYNASQLKQNSPNDRAGWNKLFNYACAETRLAITHLKLRELAYKYYGDLNVAMIEEETHEQERHQFILACRGAGHSDFDFLRSSGRIRFDGSIIV